MSSRRIKLVVHYDGTAYHGWQKQPGAPTIQGTLEEALERLCGAAVNVVGSSRTDAGVHALGQVAHFDLDSPVPTENIARALNNLLPDDIAVTDAQDVRDDFDAIRSTRSKRYRYTICTGMIRPVQRIRYCWHRPGPLDVPAMQSAAAQLVGTHDFKSFASAADTRESSVRTVLECTVLQKDDEIFVDVAATGFLYNMVRNIVGTLVEIGRGRWAPEQIDRILAAKDRAAAGPIAPASGLCLMDIQY
ncbi:MAG TPA: tRNA pseudouridine(38-40) synthase TruA [Phycisphaerales bacterium]|nr:tRNA pseudouridine(38-40) synthase TruA [Phycisphaerales bacterium]